MHHSSGQQVIEVDFGIVSARAVVVHTAVAAGAHPDPRSAASAMGLVARSAYVPGHARADVDDLFYADVRELRDRFSARGAGTSDVLHRLCSRRDEAVRP